MIVHNQVTGITELLEPLVAALNRLAAAQERIAAAEESTAHAARVQSEATGALAAFQVAQVKAAIESLHAKEDSHNHAKNES